MNSNQFNDWMKSSHFVKGPDGTWVKVGNKGVSSTVEKESPLPRIKRKDPDRQGSEEEDSKTHPRFGISVVFKMSDNRKRDLDGQIATVLDALINARGRLLAMDPSAQCKLHQGSKG